MSKQRHINLSDDECKELEQLVKLGVHSARDLARARVLLLLDRNQGRHRTIAEVVEAGMGSQGTGLNIKNRYFEGGLERALHDFPRPGAAPKIDGEVEAQLIILACSELPEGPNLGCCGCWLTSWWNWSW